MKYSKNYFHAFGKYLIYIKSGIALFLIYYWCLALDVWAWNYFKINYKIYLGFNHHFSTLTEIL